jgi:methanogen homoisocitrate dehydrogenase
VKAASERKNHLTIGTKANVLASDAYFYEIAKDEIASMEKSGEINKPVTYSMKYIDALVLDVLEHPLQYDVIVTTNLFGDILSDAAGYLCGGLGLLPSANIGMRHAFFEPVHGSAPDIAGTNTANPVAAIRSAALLLRYLGDTDGSVFLETAIQNTWNDGIKTKDIGGTASTTQFADLFFKKLELRV